jgi:hypothetical protein
MRSYHSATESGWKRFLVPLEVWRQFAVEAGTHVVHKAIAVKEALAAGECSWFLLCLQSDLHHIQWCHCNIMQSKQLHNIQAYTRKLKSKVFVRSSKQFAQKKLGELASS